MVDKEKKRLRDKKYRENHKDDLKYRYSKYKRDAKEDGRIFALSIEQFNEITSKPCYMCEGMNKGKNYCGIDRVDNKIGYIKENCLPACTTCNKLKHIWDYEELMVHVAKMVSVHLKNKMKEKDDVHCLKQWEEEKVELSKKTMCAKKREPNKFTVVRYNND